MSEPERAASAPDDHPHILVVRRGVGANCSSIGSAVEMLFLSAAFGAAILAAVSAAMPPIDESTPPSGGDPPDDPSKSTDEGAATQGPT